MELRDVPRSIPTWRTSFFELIGSTPFFTGVVTDFGVRGHSGEESARDVLAIDRVLELLRLVGVRDAGDFREDAGHLGRHEHDEGGALHAAALEPRVGL